MMMVMMMMHLVGWRGGLIPFCLLAGLVVGFSGGHAIFPRRRPIGFGWCRGGRGLVGMFVHPHLVRPRLAWSSRRGSRGWRRRDDGGRRGCLGKRDATGGKGGCKQ